MTMAGPYATEDPSAAAAKAQPVEKIPPSLLPPEEEEVAKPRQLTAKEKFIEQVKTQLARIPYRSPFATPPITEDIVNEQLELGRADRSIKKLTYQAALVAVFGTLLAVGAPFFAPLYVYHSITPEGKTAILVPLDLPNLTNPAVVSWAATSVTEILSIGFGDIEAKTAVQKKRFTPLGWKAFVKSFLSSKVSETFKRNQMVMTTVPSDTPVIVSQGVNDSDVYEWKVEVPIITTYAANNNVIKPERGTIRMTIIRVDPEQSPAGLAIDIMRQIKH